MILAGHKFGSLLLLPATLSLFVLSCQGASTQNKKTAATVTKSKTETKSNGTDTTEDSPDPVVESLSLTMSSSQEVGTCTALSVAGLDGDGSALDADRDLTLSLSSSGSALFYSDSACSSAITSVVLAEGSASATVYVKDDVAEQPTLTISDADSTLSNATTSSTFEMHYEFYSAATNFVSGTSAGIYHSYLRTFVGGTIKLLSYSPSGGLLEDCDEGTQGYSRLSVDHRYAIFVSDCVYTTGGTQLKRVFVRDTTNNQTYHVSAATNGGDANDGATTNDPVIINATCALFSSYATNLVAGDTNGVSDVFKRNLTTGTTTRVSLTNAGGEANNTSLNVSASSDCRYVVFESTATNLVTGDTNAKNDIFLRDLQAGITTRISVSSAGVQANNDSYSAKISGDGRYITYVSAATNLVSGDTNAAADIFLYDRNDSSTRRVSVTSAGVQANSGASMATIARNAYKILFLSSSSNLDASATSTNTKLFLYDIATATTTLASKKSSGAVFEDFLHYDLSENGRYLFFDAQPSTSNIDGVSTETYWGVFVRDLVTGTITKFSKNASGVYGNSDSFSANDI